MNSSTVRVIIVLLLLVIVYLPVLKDLVFDWYVDSNYSHGFLVIPIAAYLLYRDSKKFEKTRCVRWPGAVLLIAGLVLLILGSAAAEFFTARFSFVVCLTGIGIFSLGWHNFRKSWFSFFFLLFMIPIPAIFYYSATMPMQLFSSNLANQAINAVGIESVRAGNIINLPNYRLEVIEACSGLRSLITLMALGALYAKLSLDGFWRPFFLVLATIPIAIAANVFRIFVTGFGAHYISPKLADEFLHEVSGILVFLSALLMIVIFGKLIGWKRKRSF